jgi:flagellar hook-length control protein FliK
VPSPPAEATVLSSKVPSPPAEATVLSSKAPSPPVEATNLSSKPSVKLPASQGLAVPIAEVLEPQKPVKAVPAGNPAVPVEISLEGEASIGKKSDKIAKSEEKGDDALSLKAAALFKPDGVQKSEKLEAPREPVSVQVVRQTQEAMGKGRTEIRIQLDPEHLGGMTLKVVSHNGLVTASIHADNPQTKDLIEGQLAGLRHQFSEQGIKFDRVEVSTRNDSGFDASNPNGKHPQEEASHRQARRSPFLDSIDVAPSLEEEKVVVDGAIDYRA